ncbi:hypothetical protein CMO91_00890 [Candidatus Woesearchaeota archaeon]|nr:hypothetical protein [Candidatus Woesearchaeota archaeon]
MELAMFADQLKGLLPLLRTLIIIILVWWGLDRLLRFAERELLKRASTKKQKSNVEIFSRLLKYVLLVVLALFAIFSYTGSFTGIGLSLGLLSAALGWALQKPITGVASWIMLVIKRPFEIGDRIIVGEVRGDVADITLTHVYLKEVGGIVQSEENSGRIILIPNSILFEQNIINYTLQDEYVRDEVVFDTTYESDLDQAMKIALTAAKKHTKAFSDAVNEEPKVECKFRPSGISVHVRYFVPARNIQHVETVITKEIYALVLKTKKVDFAYPHTEIVLKDPKQFKR